MRVTWCPDATSPSTRPATNASMPPYASGGTLNHGGATTAMRSRFSAAGPVAVGLLLWAPSFGVGLPLINLGGPLATLPALAPAGFALSPLVRGHYEKALAVAVGAPALSLGSAVLAQTIHDRLTPCTSFTCVGFGDISPFMNTWALTGLAIGLAVSLDAYFDPSWTR